MEWSELRKSPFGISLNESQIQAFAWYAEELQAWNERINLTSVTDSAEIETKHFLDSLSCLQALGPGGGNRIVDVGSGAGFPSLPIKIVRPETQLVLIESIGKKVAFCRHIVEQLELDQVEVVHARAEQVGRDPAYRESFDWALARAVARMPTLVEYLLPLLRVGGRAIAQKGETGPAETQTAVRAMEVLGGELVEILPVELPGVAETRHLVVIEKTAATPAKYPRRPGIAAKRPLS